MTRQACISIHRYVSFKYQRAKSAFNIQFKPLFFNCLRTGRSGNFRSNWCWSSERSPSPPQHGEASPCLLFRAAIWFAERELREISRFFRDESNSEHVHAAKFAEYIITRRQSVALQVVEAPLQSWASPADVMATAFQMEVDVTASLQQLYSMAERVNDTRTTVILDPIVEMQTQSEHEFAHLLGRVKFADNQAAALLLIDNELDPGNNKPASIQG